MTEMELQEEIKRTCNRWPPPEDPVRIDVRAIDYNLSLTPTDRLRRNCLMLQIGKLMNLADTQTLTQPLEFVRTSAQRNPFWNDGAPRWEYPESDASGSQCG